MGNAGFLKRDDPDTRFVELNQPMPKRAYLKLFGDLENALRNSSDDTLMVCYYNGESDLAGGKICVDFGAGPFPIEKKFDAFCEGLDNLTIWVIYDCPRTEV